MTTKISGTGFDSLTIDELILTTPLAEQYGGSGSTGVYKMQYATPKSATGTFVDFTGIPSWAKRITISFNGVSSSGTSNWIVQVGVGTYDTTGYNSVASGHISGTAPSLLPATGGFIIYNDNSTDTHNGLLTIIKHDNVALTSNHCMSGNVGRNVQFWGSGSKSVTGNITQIRITTGNGTDSFDAGTINVMWEGFV